MPDMVIPASLAAPIGAAILGGFGALWGRISAVEKREREECDKRIAAIEERVTRLETQKEEYEARWRREVRRGAELFARASAELPRPAPPRPPEPDWHETTDVRSVRDELEREAMLRAYVESTPPRGKPPSY